MEAGSETSPTLTDNPFSTAVNIFVSPADAFRTLDARPTILFPLALLLISYIAAYSWYFAVVDYAWLVDDLIASMGDLPPDQLEVIRKAYSSMSSTVMSISTNVSVVITLLLVNSIQAGYLTLVSALIDAPYRFRHWFSLACWTYLPGLIVILGMVVNILLNDNGQLGLYDLNSLSFNNLGLQVKGSTSLQTLLNTLNIAMLWSLSLMVAGYNHWLKSGYMKACLIVLTPHVLIYGSWAAIAIL